MCPQEKMIVRAQMRQPVNQGLHVGADSARFPRTWRASIAMRSEAEKRDARPGPYAVRERLVVRDGCE